MSTIKAFFETLFSSLKSGEFIELRGLKQGKKTARFFTQSIDDAVTWAVENRDSYNIYMGVLPRNNAENGRKQDVEHSSWLWADHDAYKDKPALIMLPPSLVIQSSENGFQYYWKLAEDTTNLQVVHELNSILGKLVGGDAVGDVARILRVPETYNYKRDTAYETKLISQTNFIYSLTDVQAFCRLTPRMLGVIASGSTEGYESRSERDYAVVMSLLRAGASEPFVRFVFDQFVIGDKVADAPEHYLSFTIQKATAAIVDEPPQAESNWGIVERDNCYYKITTEGLTLLSTFVIQPQVILSAETGTDTLIGTVKAGNKQWENVAFTRNAFSKVDSFIKELYKVDWQWFGKDMDVRKLLPYLLEKMFDSEGNFNTQNATSVIGRHGDELVLSDKTFNSEGIVEKPNKVWLPTGREYPKVMFEPVGYETAQVAVKGFLDNYFQLNTIENTVAALGWFMAALFKPQLKDEDVHFPILNVFGTRGSGKTTLLVDVLQPALGYTVPRAYDANTTAFVMLSLLGSTNCFPVSFSEFRRSGLKDPDRIIRFILLGYDGSYDSRGKADQTNVSYPMLAPFTVDGEDPITDPACLERIIQLNFRPETIGEDTTAYDAFERMQNVNLNAFAYAVNTWALKNRLNFNAALAELKAEVGVSLPNRVKNNFAVIVAGVQAFRQFIKYYGYELQNIGDMAFNVSQLLMPLVETIVSPEMGRTTLMVDEFLEDVVGNIAVAQQDMFLYKFVPDTEVLYLNMNTAYSWWSQFRRSRGKPIFEKRAVLNQLKERFIISEQNLPGRYVIGAGTHHLGTGKGSAYAHEINLKLARDAGLDLPYIERFEPRIASQIGKGFNETDTFN